MKSVYYSCIPSPLDELMMTSNGSALTGLYMTPHQFDTEVSEAWVRQDDLPIFQHTYYQLSRYFEGMLTQFNLEFDLVGTEFQKRVWEELVKIPFGTTISYGDLAKRLGDNKASRAVGLANGRNPISIIVPCHRVIGANGSLTGYGGGLARKQALLSFESVVRNLGSQPFAEAIERRMLM
jgi:methylated-DNA-[protein]-cysteine S-methyltransferase